MAVPCCSLCNMPVEGSKHWCASCRGPLGKTCARCQAVNPPNARFCALCGLGLPVQATIWSLAANAAAVERRYITVVFCDLVGSTALASSMDAEDYIEVLRTVLRRLTEVVEGFGGFVGSYLGDGTLNYFGYPSANEDDTARAVLAGLAMVAAVANVAVLGEHRLEARVGIAAGDVVVGDIVGRGGARSLDLAGELPSLAARLQAEAKPGTVVVDEVVHRVIEDGFICRRLGERRFKGWDAAVAVWQVVRPLSMHGRHTGRHRSHLAPLVGRSSEAVLLADAWRMACAGAGRCMLVIGDAGIGKSRLLADLLQATAGDDHARIVCGFSELQQGVPLAPCIPVIQRAAGFQIEDLPDCRRAKLRTILAALPEPDFELIAELLSLPSQTRGQAAQLSPQKRRGRTIAALCGAIVLSSRKQPMLVAFEDVHWSDPTSAELLRTLVQSIAGCPILLVLTARPGIDPAWATHPRISTVQLNALNPPDSMELIGWIKGADSLPPETVREIAARCDGIPLYLEEVAKAAVEAASNKAADWTGIGAAPAHQKVQALPSSIHSSLLARLDRLGHARAIAEIAAAIGRDFSLELLAHVAGESQEDLWPALSRLIESGLVVPCPPDGRQFRFKHALLQDAAYGIVTRRQRLLLHARIVDALEAGFPSLAAAEPQLLAHHCTEAALPDKAAAWWLRSGIQSLMRSATTEAIAQLSRGLATVEALPRTPERERAALDLRIAYAKALIATQGYATLGTGEAFTVARAQCERLGHPPQFLTVLHGQWSHALFRGDLRSAEHQAEWILAEGEAKQDAGWLLVGCYALGVTSLPLGDFHRVCTMLRRGLARVAALGGRAYAGPIVPDPAIVMRTYLSWALMCMGRMDEAWQECAVAVEAADRLGQAFSSCFALWHDAYLTLTTVSVEAGLPRLEALHRLAADHGNTFYETVTTLFLGWSHAMLGRHAEGLTLMRVGREAHLLSQTRLYAPSYMRMEAEVLGLAGRLDEARALLLDADRMRKQMGADWDAPEFKRVQAQLLWAAGETRDAETAFLDAVALASSRSARQLELRAALAYAERLVADGRADDAARQLAPVCAALDGWGMCSEQRRARELLGATMPARPGLRREPCICAP